MTKAAFDKIAEGLKEATAILQGKSEPARVQVPRTVDVRMIRRGLNLSQARFAQDYGFSLVQIRDWEQGRSKPLGALRAYLTIIARSPDGVRALLHEAA